MLMYSSSSHYASEVNDGRFRISEVWSALRGGRWLILGTTICAVVAAALVTSFVDPVFESEATVLLTESNSTPNLLGELAGVRGLGAIAGGAAGGSVPTGIRVLQSRTMAEGVVDSLGLQVRLTEPQIPRAAVFRTVRARRDAIPGRYELRLQRDGSYSVYAEGAAGGSTLLTRTRIGELLNLGGTALELDLALRGNPPPRIAVTVLPFHAAVGELRKHLSVSRPQRDVNALRISYRTPDPVLAAAVPNALTELYIHHQNRTSRSDSRTYSEYLESQAARYGEQLEEAENRLRSFREQAQVISPEGQASAEVSRLIQLETEGEELRAEQEVLERLLLDLRMRAEGGGSTPPSYREIAAYPSMMQNPGIQSTLESLMQLEGQRSELLERRTEQNIDVQGIDRRIGELEQRLYRIASEYLKGLNNQLASVDRTLARFTGELETIPAKELEYRRLVRQQELLEQVYTLIQTKLKETEMQEAAEPGDVRVLDAALVPEEPVAPRPLLNISLAALVGLVLGSGVVVARQQLSTKIHTRRDIAAAVPGVPIVGVIPRIMPVNPESRRWIGRRVATLPSHHAQAGLPYDLITSSGAPTTEAYRALRTNLTRTGGERAPHVILITSALPGEGKTTTAANLAAALARQGARALLIDGDLRRGGLHHTFGLGRGPGLADLLQARASVPEVVNSCSTDQFGSEVHVIVAGESPSAPPELLGSHAMTRLLEEVRRSYDAVIIDTPPLNLFTDAAVLASSVDAVLVVARVGSTDQAALLDAVQQLHELHVPVRGVILNGADHLETRYRYSGYTG